MRIKNKIILFIRSHKFTLILLSLLTPALISGTIFSPHIYHTWWFTLLLFLLSINLAFCTISRLKRKGRRGRFRLKDELRWDEDSNLEPLINLFKRKRYKLNVKRCKDSSLFISAEKGRVGRFGSVIAHVGVLIILLGAAIGALGGFREHVKANVGSIAEIPYTNLSIKISAIKLDENSPKVLAQIIEDGKSVSSGTIRVNHPLCFRGMKILVSSYGYEEVKEVTIGVRNGDFRRIKFKIGEKKQIPATPLEIKVTRFIPDFRIKEGEVFSASSNFNNPACQLEIYEKGLLTIRKWIFHKFPHFHGLIANHRFTLLSFTKPLEYVLLTITSNPGINLIWVGCGVLLVGLYLAFYISDIGVWLFFKGGKLMIYGASRKNRKSFEQQFAQLICKIKEFTHSAKG